MYTWEYVYSPVLRSVLQSVTTELVAAGEIVVSAAILAGALHYLTQCLDCPHL